MTVGVMAVVALAAVLYGLDKSLAPGAGILAVATLTAVMPAKEATGITLIMAIVADWSAIWAYRGNVSRRTLIRLFPFVAIGIAAGAGFLFVADNTVTRLTIGVILAVFVSMYFLSLARKRMAETDPTAHAGRRQGTEPATDDHAGNGKTALSLAKRVICGALAGFTTMVANAGGPITSIYFLSENLSVMRFLGTTAWFYLIINLVKLPFSIGLGMITWTNFTAMAWTIPLVVAAVLCGRWVARRVSQSTFSMLVYALSVVAVIRLFL
ncbi:sulfite exporter TauE/SafE family protein [Bifidobacterium callitrichos]|nr:sulfite exporter TauE/SafE family protein [Bifidobacterium callitrichos]